MDDFDEWIKTQPHPCLHRWEDELLSLGASWDSFRRDTEEVVLDLVSGGIPLLAARDIISIASATINQSQSPMAIFWDLENLQIPSSISASDVASRLKVILAPHGNMKQFRGYASIGEGNIPEKKRSELQLSGCHLVDCPHVGRKEVVDKMIIVDAMQFAYTHPEAATLCFITGDVDYAYLLAVLQQPQWKTIVISKGTLQSMLHVNCDMKMRWETDILQLTAADQHSKIASRLPSTHSSNFSGVIDDDDDDDDEISDYDIRQAIHKIIDDDEEDDSVVLLDDFNNIDHPDDTSHEEMKTAETGSMMRQQAGGAPPAASANTVGDKGNAQSYRDALSTKPLEGLTNNEAWQDDIEILRSAMRGAPLTAGGNISGTAARKSYTGQRLREINPARFPNRESVREFLKKVIANNIVQESGEGAYKMVKFVDRPDSVRVQLDIPIPKSDLPDKVTQSAAYRPFILFVRWPLWPKGRQFPETAFYQTTEWFIILMFKCKLDVLEAFSTDPWLKAGHLVDWRDLDLSATSTSAAEPATSPALVSAPEPAAVFQEGKEEVGAKEDEDDEDEDEDVEEEAFSTTSTASQPLHHCSICNKDNSSNNRIEKIDDNFFCPICAMSCSADWVKRNKEDVIGKVTQVLELMASNDDMCVIVVYLWKFLQFTWPNKCLTKSHACLWLHLAKADGKVREFKHPSSAKTVMACLTKHVKQAMRPFPPPKTQDFSQQIECVQHLLRLNGGWMDRRKVISELSTLYPSTMKNLSNRLRLIYDAHGQKKFYVGKCHLGQILVLKRQDAYTAAHILTKAKKESKMEDKGVLVL